MICQSCNGVIGRDCFNPEECMAITRDKSDRYDSLEVELRDAMHRIEQLEEENKHLADSLRIIAEQYEEAGKRNGW